MKIDSYQEMKYPYQKNIFYYFAIFMKKIKKFKIIKIIKEKKKELREKGWKI
jgi:lipopolysaccharide core biosynthesis protein rfaY